MTRLDDDRKADAKDTRFDLEASEELYATLARARDIIEELAIDRPLAAVRLSLKMQRIFRVLEHNSAMRANGRFHISWKRISETMGGSSSQWAWDRYVIGNLSHEKSRTASRRAAKGLRVFNAILDNSDLADTTTKESPAEVKEQPKER